MRAGDLIYPWFWSDDVGLIVGHISDQWSERFIVLSEGRVFEVPINRNYKSKIVRPKRIDHGSR